jgi:drug/metabolite transporter (DMT)-like permease
MNKKITAYIMLTLSSFIFGFSFLFTKETLQSLGIFQLLGLRFLVAVIIMILLAALGLIKIRLNREKIRSLALLTLFQPVLYFIGETYGIKLTSASESGMMISLMPIAIALFSRAVLKEKLVFHQWAAIAVSVAGMALIIGAKGFEPGSGSLLGYLFLLCAITAEGVYSPLSRKFSSQCSPIEITFAIMIIGAVVFNAIGLTMAGIDGTMGSYFSDALNFQTAEGILYLAVLSSIAAFFMYNYALSKVKASTSASFCNLTTVISVLAGVTIGGEKLYTMQIAGMLMILLSIWGIISERPLISKQREITKAWNAKNS